MIARLIRIIRAHQSAQRRELERVWLRIEMSLDNGEKT